MWTDEDPFLVVHSDGSLGSAGWEVVFGQSDPDSTTQAAADPVDMEQLIDMELEADRPPPKRSAQKKLDCFLVPKFKARKKSVQFQTASKGASASGRHGRNTGPGPERGSSEGDEAGGLGQSSSSASTSRARPQTTIEVLSNPDMIFANINANPCDNPQSQPLDHE